MLNKCLFTRIDNSALIVFRICFGFLIMIEAVSGIWSGWVYSTLIEPKFTFNFIGFDFLQPLPGYWMYAYYGVMAVLGILIMLGYKYRWSMVSFTIMWTCVYLMQKTSYNNHYYLLMLLCIIMSFLPAHKNISLDSRRHPEIKKIAMPRWVWLVLVLQMWIVYTYGAIAKLYPDWWDGTFPALIMSTKKDYWLVGSFLQKHWIRYAIAYFGFFFDLLNVPLLLWKKTRIPTFLFAIFFHLFNSFIFHIGIFPYLSLAFMVFLFPSEKIHALFLKNRKEYYNENEVEVPSYRKPLLIVLSGWFLVQISLPLRHWFFKDNVLWTEEGHRMSWRMMLRAKGGHSTFKVVLNNSADTIYIDKSNYLSAKQQRSINSKPDLIWQFAQHLKKDYAEKGREVKVFVDSKVSVNGRPYRRFIDSKVDLAHTRWHQFKHNNWILPSHLE